jgi:DNA-binding PadR family transcriptional regulator
MIEAKWGVSENNRQAKFYTLTPAGRRVLRVEIESWTHFAAAIAKVIHATHQPA